MTTRLRPSELGTVLGVWAHPDDEAFLVTGLAGLVTDAGGIVACITATRGEAGTPDPDTWPPERLGRRRALELRASLAVVGVTDHEFLGWVDGTLHEVDDDDGVAAVAAAIERVAPATVITFGPDGMTGHTDHVAVSRWTTRAVAAAEPSPRLLYATGTPETRRRWMAVNDRTNAFDPDLPVQVTPEAELALQVRVTGDDLDRKVVALAAQSSQIGPLIQLLGEDALRDLVEIEAFRT